MDDIQRLLDESEIKRGLAQFARIIDSRRWAALPDVFASDVSFDYGSGGQQDGIAALRSTMDGFLDRCGGTQHLIGSIIVELDRDTATSFAYVQARHQRPGDTAGPVFDSNGEYVDRWARLAIGWRIVRRDVKWMTHTGDPQIIGLVASALG